jgi:alkanesulfonate monooxygenase SsuD/methylene tetrahydromethanopterin reductase-like flavin-dependent oxidoreductase (luciferase family)
LLEAPDLRALGLLLPAGALESSPLRDGPFAHLVPTDPATLDLVPQIDVDELGAVLPHGTPEEIAAEVATYVEAGAEHVVLCDMAAASGLDPGHGLKPLEVVAEIRAALDRRLNPASGRPA